MRVELGRLLSSLEHPPREPVALLIETAIASDLPAQYVFEARQGLVLARRGGALDPTDIERVRDASDSAGVIPEYGGVTEGVLRTLRLQVLARSTTSKERSALVAAARNPDQRIRQIAVNTCAEALEDCDDESLVWALVSGLFDPADSVTMGALSGLAGMGERFPAAAAVAWDRLPRLLESGGSDLRAATVHAAKSVDVGPPGIEKKLDAMTARARLDRSWRVRDAAAS